MCLLCWSLLAFYEVLAFCKKKGQDVHQHYVCEFHDGQALEDKFNGLHPAVITLEELRSSQHQWVQKAAASGGIRYLLSALCEKDPNCAPGDKDPERTPGEKDSRRAPGKKDPKRSAGGTAPASADGSAVGPGTRDEDWLLGCDEAAQRDNVSAVAEAEHRNTRRELAPGERDPRGMLDPSLQVCC